MKTTLTKEQYNALNKKKSKYGSIKTSADGYTFDSIAEYKRYLQLRTMYQAGELLFLGVHTRFPIVINTHPICVYESDFNYIRKGEVFAVVEDVKAVRTKEFILKKKLMLAVLGLEVTEINVLKKRKRDDNIKFEQNNARQKRTTKTRT